MTPTLLSYNTCNNHQMMVAEMNLPGLVFKRVETLTLDMLKPMSEGGIKELNPFGELPVLTTPQGRAIYGKIYLKKKLKKK